MTSSPPTINTAPIRSPVRASALSRSTSANLICHGSSRSTGVMLYLPQIAKSSGKKTRVDQPILFCIEEERFDVLLEHAKLFNEVWGEEKNFRVIKKYIKAYISDFEGANELRQRLMMVNSYEDLKSILE